MINNSKHQIISSNIAPNPIEVKFWLDTNSDTIKTYKDGKWEAMTGGGSNSNSSSNQNFLDITEIINGEIEPDAEGWYDMKESEWTKAKNSKNSPFTHAIVSSPEATQTSLVSTFIYTLQSGENWAIMMYVNIGEAQLGISLDSYHPNKIYLDN